MKHAIFTVRYSLLDQNRMTAWKMSRDSSLNKYKKELFDNKRLSLRQEMFARITIPSIQAAINSGPKRIKTEVHVITSQELPEPNKLFLEKLSLKYNFLKIFYEDRNDVSLTKYETEYVANLDKNDRIASIRIDDDDAISVDYLSRLSIWMDLDISNFILSMCFGYGAEFNENLQITKIDEYRSRLIAAALAYIYTVKDQRYENIYQIGAHINLDQRLPTILDQSSPAFIRSFHKYNDSENTFDKSIPKTNKEIDLENIEKLFF